MAFQMCHRPRIQYGIRHICHGHRTRLMTRFVTRRGFACSALNSSQTSSPGMIYPKRELSRKKGNFRFSSFLWFSLEMISEIFVYIHPIQTRGLETWKNQPRLFVCSHSLILLLQFYIPVCQNCSRIPHIILWKSRSQFCGYFHFSNHCIASTFQKSSCWFSFTFENKPLWLWIIIVDHIMIVDGGKKGKLVGKSFVDDWFQFLKENNWPTNQLLNFPFFSLHYVFLSLPVAEPVFQTKNCFLSKSTVPPPSWSELSRKLENCCCHCWYNHAQIDNKKKANIIIYQKKIDC